MIIESPEVKRVIMNCILYTDEVNEQGVQITRATFDKNNVRTMRKVKAKLFESMELSYDDGSEIVWVSYKDAIKDTSRKWVMERYTKDPIEFSAEEVAVAKMFLKSRSEIFDVSEEALDILEAIEKGAIK